MHSVQPSRGRILFEVLCGLTVVASMVGAWQQTGASALLTSAAAAGLFSMVRLFDLGRRLPEPVEEPQRIAFEPVEQADVHPLAVVEPDPPVVEFAPAVETVSDERDFPEEAPRSAKGRRKGGSRKGSGRRVSAAKSEKTAKPVVEDAELAADTLREELEALMPSPVASDDEQFPPEPAAHPHHAPLFEPEPFVRMQRQAFGRRGRL